MECRSVVDLAAARARLDTASGSTPFRADGVDVGLGAAAGPRSRAAARRRGRRGSASTPVDVRLTDLLGSHRAPGTSPGPGGSWPRAPGGPGGGCRGASARSTWPRTGRTRWSRGRPARASPCCCAPSSRGCARAPAPQALSWSSSTTRAVRRSGPAPGCRTSPGWSPTSTSSSPPGSCAACAPRSAAARRSWPGRGAADVRDLPPGRLPRLVVVVDEFRVLAQELPDFVDGLVRLAAVGRSWASTWSWRPSGRRGWSARRSGRTRTCGSPCACRTGPTPRTSWATRPRPGSATASPGGPCCGAAARGWRPSRRPGCPVRSTGRGSGCGCRGRGRRTEEVDDLPAWWTRSWRPPRDRDAARRPRGCRRCRASLRPDEVPAASGASVLTWGRARPARRPAPGGRRLGPRRRAGTCSSSAGCAAAGRRCCAAWSRLPGAVRGPPTWRSTSWTPAVGSPTSPGAGARVGGDAGGGVAGRAVGAAPAGGGRPPSRGGGRRRGGRHPVRGARGRRLGGVDDRAGRGRPGLGSGGAAAAAAGGRGRGGPGGGGRRPAGPDRSGGGGLRAGRAAAPARPRGRGPARPAPGRGPARTPRRGGACSSSTVAGTRCRSRCPSRPARPARARGWRWPRCPRGCAWTGSTGGRGRSGAAAGAWRRRRGGGARRPAGDGARLRSTRQRAHVGAAGAGRGRGPWRDGAALLGAAGPSGGGRGRSGGWRPGAGRRRRPSAAARRGGPPGHGAGAAASGCGWRWPATARGGRRLPRPGRRGARRGPHHRPAGPRTGPFPRRWSPGARSWRPGRGRAARGSWCAGGGGRACASPPPSAWTRVARWAAERRAPPALPWSA